MPESSSLSDITSPLLRRLHDEWERRRRGREFPARSDFDPLDLRYLLGNLSLVDALYAPLRFRFRLHGSRNVERLGIDLTGKETDAIPFERTRKLIWAHYEAVVAQRMPVVRRREMGIGEDRVWHYEVLTLPLSRDGETIDMLMSGLVWNK